MSPKKKPTRVRANRGKRQVRVEAVAVVVETAGMRADRETGDLSLVTGRVKGKAVMRLRAKTETPRQVTLRPGVINDDPEGVEGDPVIRVTATTRAGVIRPPQPITPVRTNARPLRARKVKPEPPANAQKQAAIYGAGLPRRLASLEQRERLHVCGMRKHIGHRNAGESIGSLVD